MSRGTLSAAPNLDLLLDSHFLRRINEVPVGRPAGDPRTADILALGISLGSLIVLTLIQTRVTQNVLVEREARLLASAAQLTANAIDDFHRQERGQRA